MIAKLGWNNTGAVGWLTKHYGVSKRAELTLDQAVTALDDLLTRVAVAEAEAQGVPA